MDIRNQARFTNPVAGDEVVVYSQEVGRCFYRINGGPEMPVPAGYAEGEADPARALCTVARKLLWEHQQACTADDREELTLP